MSDPDGLIPVSTAAATLGLKRQSLDDRLRARGIVPVRRVVGGRVRVFLTADQFLAAREQLELDPVVGLGRDQALQVDQVDDQVASGSVQVDQAQRQVDDQADRPVDPDANSDRRKVVEDALRARLHELELENARLRGSLEMSDRVEQSAQRVADRLERQIAAVQGQLVEVQERARRELVSLAREIGIRDQTVAELRSKLELLADVERDRDDGRRRWWPFGR
jgi:hypothetical protein